MVSIPMPTFFAAILIVIGFFEVVIFSKPKGKIKNEKAGENQLFCRRFVGCSKKCGLAVRVTVENSDS